jgi:hypothetical protein
MDLLKSLRPKDKQRDSNISFDVGPARASHAPSVKSIGITGQITGSRADIVIADDVEVLNNVQTQSMRDKLAQTVKEFEAVLKPGGRIIYLGTPQTEMSLYNLLPQRGYQTRIWPARMPSSQRENLAPFILNQPIGPNAPTDPDRFDEADLLEREASYGRSGFALQFMLDTSLSDGNRYPLKLSDLIVLDLNTDIAPVKVAWGSLPQCIIDDLPVLGLSNDRYHKPLYMSDKWDDYTGSIMTIDPSGRGRDETGYCVVKMLNSQLFVLEAGGLAGGYSQETLTKLAGIAKKHKVNLVQVESNFGDGMFTQLFKPILQKHHPVSIEEVRHNIQKERRIIDTLEPVMNQHRLIVDRSLIREDFDSTTDPTYKLFYQMTRLTRDRGALAHDDRLDALAMAVGYWSEQMAKDTDKVEQEHLEVLREKEWEKFMEGAVGAKRRGFGWISL